MKKYRIIIFFLFLISIVATDKVYGQINELPLLGKIIYVDPGHGGADPGANHKDILEKNINLEISKILAGQLGEKGAIVYLTREGDYDLARPNIAERKRSDLSRRIRMINESACDLYLSIHLNATTSSTWRGAQVFYDDVNEKNKILGEKIQASFKKHLASRRKLKQINNLYMYRMIKRVGVLLEVGFLSNANERYILQKQYYQRRVANAIVEGVINYFSE
ncbi:MAG TPA: N-acetylmuramoyl-L-alanine amidase CwlD [Mollicutes bacterium]|nr:N-acetylmuramoyl-L-alanine amidase CwlD [Mollicutes bacterium]